MEKKSHSFLAAIAAAFAAFSSIPGAAQVAPGEEMTVEYGTVDRVDPVTVGSNGQPKGVGAGVVIGGLAGSYNSSHGHEVRDAAAGAVAGALLQSAIKQHKNKHNGAFQYTVNLVGGGTIAVVVEHGDIKAGDCVAVEQGASANVRSVSSVHCEQPTHPALKDPAVQASAQKDATDCKAAKDAALKANTEQEIDVAVKKVRVFCES